MKYLALIVILVLAYMVWRSARLREAGERPPPDAPPGAARAAAGHGAVPGLLGAPAARRSPAGRQRAAVLHPRTPGSGRQLT